MIVCHCNLITDKMILHAIETLQAEDPWRQLTPGRVYRHLGRRPVCGGCLPSVVAMVVEKSDLLRSGKDLNDEAVQALRDLLHAAPFVPNDADEDVMAEDRATVGAQ